MKHFTQISRTSTKEDGLAEATFRIAARRNVPPCNSRSPALTRPAELEDCALAHLSCVEERVGADPSATDAIMADAIEYYSSETEAIFAALEQRLGRAHVSGLARNIMSENAQRTRRFRLGGSERDGGAESIWRARPQRNSDRTAAAP